MSHKLAVLALSLSVALGAAAQAPFLVSDINQHSSGGAVGSNPASFFALGDTVLFTALRDLYGTEIWKSSNGQASMVKDINLAGNGSNPIFYGQVGGALLFSANDGGRGFELWRTDGTEDGTTIVRDIHPTGSGAQGGAFTFFGGRLVFLGNDGTTGTEPWVSDGTQAGTQLLLDLNGTSAGSGVTHLRVLGDRLLIFAAGGLWISDGTTAGTTFVTPTGIVLGSMQVVGSTLYYAATGTDGAGRELWKTDGTAAGTQRVSDIAPGAANGIGPLPRMAALGGTLYFLAADDSTGYDLWQSDGTAAGTQLVKTLTNSSPGAIRLFELNGLLYIEFTTGVPGELWRSNGTAAGTFVVDSAVSQTIIAFGAAFYLRDGDFWTTDGTTKTLAIDLPAGASAALPTFTGGRLYFRATDSTGIEPWISETGVTATTRRLANIGLDRLPSSNPAFLTAAGNRLVFYGSNGIAASDVWGSDGTAAGTLRIGQFADQWNSGRVQTFTSWRDRAYFAEPFGKLWRSDGTVGGTALLKNFAQGYNIPGVYQMFPGSAYLFLHASDGDYDSELWRTDGTLDGTINLGTHLLNHDQPENIGAFTELAGRVFFTGSNLYDPGLWATEGTDATTKLLDKYSSSDYSFGAPVAAAGAIFVNVRAPGLGHELWRSDGVAGSLAIVKDIADGPVSSSPEQLTAAGRFLFFVADDGANGAELWRSDGTAGGTIRLTDIMPGSGDAGIEHLTAAGSLVYFAANDGLHGVELWRSDGSPAGTSMVADLKPGAGTSSPEHLVFADGMLWLSADDGLRGAELWRVRNGVLELVADLNGGTDGSLPDGMTQAGSLLFFAATDANVGRELWAVPLTQAVMSIGDARLFEGTGGQRMARFTVTRSGDTSGPAAASFTTIDGSAVAASDYVAQSGSVVLGGGQTSTFLDVVVTSDAAIEAEESFFVQLSAPSAGVALARSTGVAIIQDDDRRAELSIVLEQKPRQYGYDPDLRTFVLTNAGPSTATELELRFSESPYALEISHGSCYTREHLLVCRLSEPLAAGESRQIDVIRRPYEFSQHADTAFPPGPTVTASVTAAEQDTNPADNSVSRILTADEMLMMPAYLSSNSSASGTYLLPMVWQSQVTVTLTSSTPSVAISPSSAVLAPGARLVPFTLTTANYSGPAKITIKTTAYSYGDTTATIHVVPAGSQARLDVAIVAKGSEVVYGNPATVTVQLAARRHDGTWPTGLVTLLSGGNIVAQQQAGPAGQTVFTLNNLSVGRRTYTVQYHGDANFHPLGGASAQVIVNGWPTTVDIVVPPQLCAGPQQVAVYVRNTANNAAPTGSVEVTVGYNALGTFALSPTGNAGESVAMVSRTFQTADFYITARYLPTGTFDDSSEGLHFLTVNCIPLNVRATATSIGSVTVTWTPNGAHHYEVLQAYNRTGWSQIGTTTGSSWVASSQSANFVQLFTVKAIDASGNTIGYGVPDLSSTILFNDDPIVPRVTPIRGTHLQQIRIGARALEYFGSNVDTTWNTAVPPGTLIQPAELMELRRRVVAYRRSLGFSTPPFTDPTLTTGMHVKAVHIQELRDLMK